MFFFFKQKTAYERRISDWSSDVCSADLFIITYVVEEGKRYKFGDVKVESQLRDFDGEKLAKNLPMHKGDWYNAKQVEDTIDNLNETAGAFGYAFADVRPQYRSEEHTSELQSLMRISYAVYCLEQKKK